MKKHICILVLFFLGYVSITLLPVAGYGQNNVIISEPGDSSQNYPFNADNTFSRSVSIYEWDSLNSLGNFNGNITEIGYYVKETTNDPIQIRIYLKQTQLDVFQDEEDWDELSNNAIQVYASTVAFLGSGWHYLGIEGGNMVYPIITESNLLVLCEQWETLVTPSPTFSFTSQNSSKKHAFMCADTQLNELETDDKRPDIGIKYISDPLNFQIVNPTSNSLTLNWDLNINDSVLIVRREGNGDFGDPIQGNTTLPAIGSLFCNGTVIDTCGSTSYTDSPLDPGTTYYYKILSYYKSDNDQYFFSPGTVSSGTTKCFNYPNTIGFITGVDTTICEGSNPNTILGSEMDTGTQYQWLKSSPDSNSFEPILNATQQNYLPGSLTANTYYKRKATIGVCTDTSNIVSVNVLSGPGADITISTGTSMCINTTLEIIIQPHSMSSTIEWSRTHYPEIVGIPESGTSSSISGILTANPMMTEAVSMEFTITIHSSDPPFCDKEYKRLIMIKPIPAPSDIIGEESVCWGSELKYTLEDQDPDINYHWSILDSDVGEIIGSSTEENVVVMWHETNAQASTDLRVERSFDGYDCIMTDFKTITVNPLKAPTDNLIRKNTANPNRLFLMCSKHINDSAVGFAFDWGYVNDGTDVPNTDFKDQYFCVFEDYDSSNHYNYYVDISYNNNSVNCKTRTYYIPTWQPVTKESFTIYPNPNNGSFILDISSDYIGETTIELFNMMGSLVHRLNILKDQHRQSIHLNLNRLGAGIYIIKTHFGEGEKSIQKVSVY